MRLKPANGMDVAKWEGGQNATSGFSGPRPPPTNPGRTAGRDGWVTILGGLWAGKKRRRFCPTALCVLLLICGCRSRWGGWSGAGEGWCASYANVPADILPLPSGRQAGRRLLPMTHQRMCLRIYSRYRREVIRPAGGSVLMVRVVSRKYNSPCIVFYLPSISGFVYCVRGVVSLLLLCFFRSTSLSLLFCFLLSTLSLLLYYCSAVLLLLFCFLLSTSLLHCIGFFCSNFAGLRTSLDPGVLGVGSDRDRRSRAIAASSGIVVAWGICRVVSVPLEARHTGAVTAGGAGLFCAGRLPFPSEDHG